MKLSENNRQGLSNLPNL